MGLNTVVILAALNQKPNTTHIETSAHTITYVTMPDGEMYCLPKGSRLQTCSYKAREVIYKIGVVKSDGTFRSVKINPMLHLR